MDFSPFDTRGYPRVPVAEGYAEWAETYAETVRDEMDQRLLARLGCVRWPEVKRAVDLACGTGRIGVWLREQGVRHVDGIDLTSRMLEDARATGAYAETCVGDLLPAYW